MICMAIATSIASVVTPGWKFLFSNSLLYNYIYLPPQQVNYSLKMKKILFHCSNATKTVLVEKDEGQEENKTFILNSIFLDKQNLEVLQ